MDDARWQRAKQVFHEALEKTGPARARFVAAACGEDDELRAQVNTLLAAHADAGEFLTSPTGPGGDEVAKGVAAVAAAGAPEGPGTRIGPYKLLQVIGEGGMGVVYMAEQEQPIRRRVALKIIKLGMDTREVIARFEAERQALALMDHSGIAKVLDAGATDSGRPYFVMELVKGVPITEYCDANRSSTRERLELFMDVCRAIHHAHEKGIVHRDIKPTNVLVTLHDGTPVAKVIDFGIAKAMNQPLTEKTLFTAYGEFAGTPAYMSPEQAALGGLDVDRRCDIYALGVLLYELLTGTTPFEPERLRSRAFLEIMRIIREDDPPTPSARLSTLGDRLAEIASRRQVEPHALARLVRGDLDWIVTRALEKDRRRRYDSAVALADDIARHFRHEPVSARRPSAAYRAGKFARRRRRGLLVAASIAMAVLVGGAVAQIGRGEAGRAPGLPVIEPLLTRIIGSDTLRIHEAVLSPDGRWVAFTTATPEFEGSLWIVSVEGGAPRRLTDARDARGAVWFSDGSRIAYAAWTEAGRTIMTAPFDGHLGQVSGPPQRVIAGGVVSSAFRVSPDGRWIAFHGWHGSDNHSAIKVVAANGGEERTLAVHWRLWPIDWSRDGQHLFYHARLGDSPDHQRLFRVPVNGGEPEEVHELPSGPSAPAVPYRITRLTDAADGPPLEVRTYDGHPVARIALPGNARTDQAGRTFTADGRRMLAMVSGTVGALRVISLDGGAPRQLGEARVDEQLLGWWHDGHDVLLATPLEGRQALMRVSATGGAAREIGPTPDRGGSLGNFRFPVTLSSDGQHIAYSRPTPGQPHRTLVIRPAAGGEERIITRALTHSSEGLAGPGGTPDRAGGDFLYREARGNEVQVRATPPNGPSRLLRSFPASAARAPVGVHGNRVAYAADERRIEVAEGPDGAAKEVAMVPDGIAFGSVVWSPDGRWIAAIAYVGGSPRNYDYALKVLVVGVTPEGDVFAPARLIDTPIIYAAWGLQWLPDGSAVTLTGQRPPEGRLGVWLVPVRDERPPALLTSAEPGAIGGLNFLSPDGRHVAYQTQAERGSSIWLADLGDALADIGRR